MLRKNMIISLVILFITLSRIQCIVPTTQIKMYPNTQDSPSLYMFAFKTNTQLVAGQYIVINMNWLSTPVDPYHCILVNTTLNIQCTNLDNPDFQITFEKDKLTNHNPKLTLFFQKCLIIKVVDQIMADTQYFLQIALHNNVENLQRFSTSAQIYCLSKDGLVYEENYNFGSILCQTAVSSVLNVNPINDLSTNIPGSLSTLKVQIKISIPIQSQFSSLFFILQEPFKFSESSYQIIEESDEYSTTPTPLYAAPIVYFSRIISPNIFYIAFRQKFVINREFIIGITQIMNPFQISSSNISIYSANFNSLTPLEQFQQLYPLSTVSQSLSIILGLPYDMPMNGPCKFYKSRENFYKISFNMPKSLPKGYSIQVFIDQNTIISGSAYVTFQSTQFTTRYHYTSQTITMKGMGPISQGSLISITFLARNSGATNFYVQVYIDTEDKIQNTASSYLFKGRADATAVNSNAIVQSITDDLSGENSRITAYLIPPQSQSDYTNFNLIITFDGSGVATGSGSYVDMYFSPQVKKASGYNKNTDCKFSTYSYGSCISTVQQDSQFFHIKVQGSTNFLTNVQANPFSGTRTIYIKNLRFPRVSTNKYMYQTYFRLFKSNIAIPVTYIQTKTLTVLPPVGSLSQASFSYYGNTYDLGVLYPGFMRFQCSDFNQMNYVIHQNQVRIITFLSNGGFQGLGTFQNEQSYPCTSNIEIQCFFNQGRTDSNQIQNQWKRIHCFFPSNQQNLQNFHIIIPHTPTNSLLTFYTYYVGAYNNLTKDYRYIYRGTQISKTSISSTALNAHPNLLIDFDGKAGSYRQDVQFTIEAASIPDGLNFIVVSSPWSLLQNEISKYSETYTNPTFSYGQKSPLSTKTAQEMFMAVIPFQCSSCPHTFTLSIDSLHMPYHYDLPDYYIYLIDNSGAMISSNQFLMTNGGIFYQANLNSLTLQCQQNYLGVKNTACRIIFGTQNPLKADSTIVLVFSGMNIATQTCQVFLSNGTKLQSTCISTQDNKNVTIQLEDVADSYQYPIGNFTVKVRGISIEVDTISQSVSLFVYDKSGQYIIEKGTRIFTTTVSRPQYIEISQISYSYISPLSSNKMSLSFSIPRKLYDDQRLGFLMGKDLSDVNVQIQRLRMILTRKSDGLVIKSLQQMVISEYKILFTLQNREQLIIGNYTLQIYGIMTPASHQNGDFSIIYQRQFDKAYTLTNILDTSFPEFNQQVFSNINLESFYNTQGQQQTLIFTIINKQLYVNDDMIWIINFPSYYSQLIFNQEPYCMIDLAPIDCQSDPMTPYQIIIKNSPKIINPQILYTITINGVQCPRAIYMADTYPSRDIFIGILENQISSEYAESSLIYPQQNINPYVSGSLIISKTEITSALIAFSTIYMILQFHCNTLIPANSYLSIKFPKEFDNFNNQNIAFILKKTSPSTLLSSGLAQVQDRTLTLIIPSNINANVEFQIQLPTLPSPKTECLIQMSLTNALIIANDRKSIIAVSSIGSNQAVELEFIKDPRYISFNHDSSIIVTSGTYSQIIDITSSDSEQFLSNIQISLSSTGFTFQPSQVFLKIGDSRGQFRVASDSDLLPISYTYSAIKTQQVNTYYTITQNNNIIVVNTPVSIVIPTTINVPIGGCSQPFFIQLTNPPLYNIRILFNYDNKQYNEDLFWVNQYITELEIQFTTNITKNIVSFCSSSLLQDQIDNGLPNSFQMHFIISGTNQQSYQFSPSDIVTINLNEAVTTTQPSISIQIINQQKTMIQFNVTTNTNGILYYHLQVGTTSQALSDQEIKVSIKKNQYIHQQMSDYLSRMYSYDRDKRIGLIIKNSGEHTIKFQNLLPQRNYRLCLYLQTQMNQITSVKCKKATTSKWGTIKKAFMKFDHTLSSDQLNKVMCFFTQQVDTETVYAVDLEGNSCYNYGVKNMYYKYPGQTFSNQKDQTYLYILDNPYLSSDPSPYKFQDLFVSNRLKSTVQTSAISKFGINYMKVTYISSFDAYSLLGLSKANDLTISFQKPVYQPQTNQIIINQILMTSQGTVYFVLYLYKQIKTQDNTRFVNIRLTSQPSKQQIINCQNWQGRAAEGCARAVYAGTSLTVRFPNIKQNCMYRLYYIAAGQFPLRPNLASQYKNQTIVTFIWERIFEFNLIMLIFGILLFN